MSETFRQFYVRRNGITFPTNGGEEAITVLHRMAETMADWMDELAARAQSLDNSKK